MTDDAWSSDPRFTKRETEQGFTRLAAPPEKSEGFVEGIEHDHLPVDAQQPTQAPPATSYTQQQLDELVATARAEGLAAGEAKADEQFLQMQTEHKALVDAEFAAFMGALKDDLASRQPLLKPVRNLALALAEHLARIELSQSHSAIEAVVNTAIDGLDPTDLGAIEIHVSEAWARRLKAEPLQGLTGDYPVIADEDLYDGDVRLLVNDAQVEDLVAQRVQQLAQQLDGLDFADVVETETEVEAAKEAVAQSAALADDAVDADFEELPQIAGDNPGTKD
ncbi:MAG: FliH/SctL family protein [Pseudomonadota bacterium]|nr:FliH/SctL family protein [Pseudomonadota bacterium]